LKPARVDLRTRSRILNPQSSILNPFAWPLRIAVARLRPFNGAAVVKVGIVGIIVALFLAGDYAVFRRVFRAAASIEEATPFFAIGVIRNFLELVLLIAFVVLFFSALTSAIGALFLDQDLEIYHASPRRRLSLIVSRWVKTYVQSAYVVFAFLVPLFFAFHAQYHTAPGIVAAGVAAFVLLLTIPVSAAMLVILLLVRFFPVRRVQQIAATLAVLFMTVAIVGVRMARPERLFGEVQTDDVVTVLRQIELPAAENYPSSWVASAVAADDSAVALQELGRVGVVAAVALAFFLLVARSLYFTAWVRASESQAPVAFGAGSLTRLIDRLTRRLSGSARALIGKEVRILVRDAAQWSQLMMMLALLFLYFYNIQMMPLEGDARAVLLAYLNLGMAGFVVAAICLRFAYPSLSAEGKAFWLIESAPVSYRLLLWVKVLTYVTPLLFLTLLLVALANLILAAPAEVWAYTIAGAVFITVTLVTLGVAMGALSPDFKRENAMEVALSLGGFAYMAIALGYTGIMMLLFARPTQRLFLRLLFGIDSEASWVTRVTPVAAGVGLSMLLILLPIEIAQRRVTARRRG
jgi:ABC-2 type transport system permease protein